MKIRIAKKIMKARLLMKKNGHWFHVINLPYWKVKHNLMLTHKSIDHRITKAMSLTKKKQRMNKEEKCCGNCHWFDNEDIYGVGWCTINSCDVSCDFVCIRHIN